MDKQNGFIKIRVMADGRYADCWQRVEDDQVVGYVNDAGAPVQLPAVHDAVCLEGGVLHFAPNVLRAPDADPPVAALLPPADAAPAPLLIEG